MVMTNVSVTPASGLLTWTRAAFAGVALATGVAAVDTGSMIYRSVFENEPTILAQDSFEGIVRTGGVVWSSLAVLLGGACAVSYLNDRRKGKTAIAPSGPKKMPPHEAESTLRMFERTAANLPESFLETAVLKLLALLPKEKQQEILARLNQDQD